jgi:hypothetical protein
MDFPFTVYHFVNVNHPWISPIHLEIQKLTLSLETGKLCQMVDENTRCFLYLSQKRKILSRQFINCPDISTPIARRKVSIIHPTNHETVTRTIALKNSVAMRMKN